jgi:hypothetical protein
MFRLSQASVGDVGAPEGGSRTGRRDEHGRTVRKRSRHSDQVGSDAWIRQRRGTDRGEPTDGRIGAVSSSIGSERREI